LLFDLESRNVGKRVHSSCLNSQEGLACLPSSQTPKWKEHFSPRHFLFIHVYFLSSLIISLFPLAATRSSTYTSPLNTHLQVMQFSTLIFFFCAPLATLAAPIDRSFSYYHARIPVFETVSSSSVCHRRWRHHGSHLAFRASRLHTCCLG